MTNSTEPKYCAAPWKGLHINTEGDIKTCCAGYAKFFKNLHTADTIDEALTSAQLIELRETIKSGKLHTKYCHNCIKAEQFGSSEREWHNEINSDFDISQASLTEDIVPTIVDVRWNTTCNLSCNYCSSMCSSKWGALEGKQVNSDVKPYYKNIVDYISARHNDLRHVALVGGEPLLLNENIEVIRNLPDNCTILVITNLSVNLERNKVYNMLMQKPNVSWSISFDNISERLEYVRHGTTFELLDKNLTTLVNKMNEQGTNHHGGVHAVYNIYNCTRLRELRRYVESHGLTIHWQTLHYPDSLDVSKHSKEIHALALQEINLYKQEFELTDSDKQFLLQVERTLESIIAQETYTDEKFIDLTEKIETTYHPDTNGKFVQLWPEFNGLLTDGI